MVKNKYISIKFGVVTIVSLPLSIIPHLILILQHAWDKNGIKNNQKFRSFKIKNLYKNTFNL